MRIYGKNYSNVINIFKFLVLINNYFYNKVLVFQLLHLEEELIEENILQKKQEITLETQGGMEHLVNSHRRGNEEELEYRRNQINNIIREARRN